MSTAEDKAASRPQLRSFTNLAAIQYRTQSISDAVAISVTPNLEGLHELFSTIHDLALDLLREGYFIRGAIVKGRLFHSDTTVFGDALVKAYDLESQVVRYPRIMITREVALDVNQNRGRRRRLQARRSTDPKALAAAIRTANITDNVSIGLGIRFDAKGQNDKVKDGAIQNRGSKLVTLAPKEAANAKPEWPLPSYQNRG